MELEVKEFANRDNTLYMAVTMGDIKTEGVSETGFPANTDGIRTASRPSAVSIPEILGKINPNNGDFFKYVPDGLLTDEQMAEKQAAMAKEKPERGGKNDAGKPGANGNVPPSIPGDVRAMQGGVPIIGGAQNGPAQSGQEIMQTLADALGMPADNRRRTYLRGLRDQTRGYTRQNSGVIHVGDAQAMDVAGHEFGHNFDRLFGLQAHADIPGMISRYCQNPMQAAWLSQYPTADQGGEMMAEYTKTWLMNRADAVAFGGNAFTDYFESQLKSRGWLGAMQRASADMRRYLAATASERAMASIDLVEKPINTDRYGKGLKGLARTVFDKTIPLTDLTAARRREQGADYDRANDPRTLALAKESTIGNMVNECLYGKHMLDPQGNAVLDVDGDKVGALSSILERVDRRDERAFNALWALLHAKDRNAADKAVFSNTIDMCASSLAHGVWTLLFSERHYESRYPLDYRIQQIIRTRLLFEG